MRKKSDRLRGLEILYEDDFLFVVDKPQGMLATHTHLHGKAAREAQLTAENVLNDYVRKGQLKSKKRVWLVHRLDRDTSGVMMFAKSEAIAEAMRAKWNEITEKTYLLAVKGVFSETEGRYESWLKEDDDGYRVRVVAPETPGARAATTSWKVLSTNPREQRTLLEAKLHSGRKNQIRVQFAAAGHPVIGDVKYGGPKAARMFLHSAKLAFIHPVSGERLEFSAVAEKGFER